MAQGDHKYLVLNHQFTDLDTWSVSGVMSTFKGESSACTVNSFPEMILNGGYSEEDSTISTYDGERFKGLPPMPLGLSRHCVVALDGDDLFVTGGKSANESFEGSRVAI